MTRTDPTLLAERKKARELTGHLQILTDVVQGYLDALDDAMKRPSTHERGRTIGRISSALGYANDSARHFGLGVDFAKDPHKTPKGKAANAAALARCWAEVARIREVMER